MVFCVQCFVDDMTMEGRESTHHSRSVQNLDRPLKIAGERIKPVKTVIWDPHNCMCEFSFILEHCLCFKKPGCAISLVCHTDSSSHLLSVSVQQKMDDGDERSQIDF